MADPFQRIGKPEPLSWKLSLTGGTEATKFPLKYLDADIGLRRINLEHRQVYPGGNTQIGFLACRFHYED